MKQKIAQAAFLVREYDEAIDFFTEKLDFRLVEDTDRGEGKRWVLVAPPGSVESCLLLARADSARQQALVGDQAGGRVFLFLHTDDFWRDYERMTARGVHFMEKPRTEPYGTVAVFEDLYGNKWDLLELKDA